MKEFIDFLSQPWPWYVAGPIIAVVMLLLILFGRDFGVSHNLRTACSILGAGKNNEFFNFNWRNQLWNLVFAVGLIIGGYLSHEFLTDSGSVNISQATINELQGFGLNDPGASIAPMEILSWESLMTVKGFIMLVVGGFLVGFGARYAGGCTSGHAISGLSDLQLPSLIATVGFFIGGLLVTYFVLPHILTL